MVWGGGAGFAHLQNGAQILHNQGRELTHFLSHTGIMMVRYIFQDNLFGIKRIKQRGNPYKKLRIHPGPF